MTDHAHLRLLNDLTTEVHTRQEAAMAQGVEPIHDFLAEYHIDEQSLREWTITFARGIHPKLLVEMATAGDLDKTILVGTTASIMTGFIHGYLFALNQTDSNALTHDSIVKAARDLRSVDGENIEYDRALVELVSDTTGLSKIEASEKVLDD